MEERLDKLFKDKLANHKVAPTTEAWEQINSQLAKKKNNIWTKRLAIAATLILLVSVSFISYQYINGISQNNPFVSQTQEMEISDNSVTQHNESNGEAEQMIAFEEKTENSEYSTENNADFISSDKPAAESVAVQKKEISTAQMSEIISPEDIIVLVEPNLLLESEPIAAIAEHENDQVKEGLDEENAILAEAVIEPEKNYPKVRIVYKADANSELITSNNRNILDKGIKKITRFSDEHIVTDQVKTKLRNTKDDLLALNFGKLLNKSNRDVEN